jgi:hypothetical protein
MVKLLYWVSYLIISNFSTCETDRNMSGSIFLFGSIGIPTDFKIKCQGHGEIDIS